MSENPCRPGTPEYEAWDLQTPGRELDAFLGADTEPVYDWLIPGLLERRDRLILTGGEGDGKSTLLRQLGVQAASGVHPFGGPDYKPLRVLLLDLENSEDQLRRELRPVRIAAGERYGGGMYVEVRPTGINLLDPQDKEWFFTLCKERAPDLLITGPSYKLAAGDPTEEGPAKVVADHLDRVRYEQKHGTAVLLEAHSPHGTNGHRPTRPYGASLWLRWPEFGYHLAKSGALRPWRGQRDASRQWPAELTRGGEWPWTPGRSDAEPIGDMLGQEDQKTLAAIADLIAAGKEPNLTAIRKAIPGQSHERTSAVLNRLRYSGRVVETRGKRDARVFTPPQDPIPGMSP